MLKLNFFTENPVNQSVTNMQEINGVNHKQLITLFLMF